MSELRTEIHNLFEVSERHELPRRMSEVVENPELLHVVSEKYKTLFPDLTHDYMRDYFQESIADRSNFMQDYTPESICQIVSGVIGEPKTIADLCAGTGSLTIGAWQRFPVAEFICYEISSASVPFLLFNLAIRNVSAFVVKGDLLTEEYESVYKVEKGTVKKGSDFPHEKVDAIISNPPYSLKWSGEHDLRFGNFSTPPKKAADFAFILIGLSMAKESGSMAFVLPHGVLFRSGAEAEVREQLLKSRLIHSVIGLPEKLFANTDIPVCILTIRKSSDGVFLISAEDEFKKQKSKNVMEQKHVNTVLSVFDLRKDVEDLSHLAKIEELQENGFNLNIPRYVNRYHPEPIPAPVESMKELIELKNEIKENEARLYESMKTMIPSDQVAGEFSEFLGLFKEWISI